MSCCHRVLHVSGVMFTVQVAKIYISVYSDPHGKDIAMRGLSRLEG